MEKIGMTTGTCIYDAVDYWVRIEIDDAENENNDAKKGNWRRFDGTRSPGSINFSMYDIYIYIDR